NKRSVFSRCDRTVIIFDRLVKLSQRGIHLATLKIPVNRGVQLQRSFEIGESFSAVVLGVVVGSAGGIGVGLVGIEFNGSGPISEGQVGTAEVLIGIAPLEEGLGGFPNGDGLGKVVDRSAEIVGAEAGHAGFEFDIGAEGRLG